MAVLKFISGYFIVIKNASEILNLCCNVYFAAYAVFAVLLRRGTFKRSEKCINNFAVYE